MMRPRRLRRYLRPSTDQGEPVASVCSAGGGIPLRFLGSSAALGPGVALRTHDRYRVATTSERSWAIVIDPCGPDEIRRRRAESPCCRLVIWDRRPAALPAAVSAALEAGADAFVCSGRIDVLVAHLDALARRSPTPDIAPVS